MGANPTGPTVKTEGREVWYLPRKQVVSHSQDVLELFVALFPVMTLR